MDGGNTRPFIVVFYGRGSKFLQANDNDDKFGNLQKNFFKGTKKSFKFAKIM